MMTPSEKDLAKMAQLVAAAIAEVSTPMYQDRMRLAAIDAMARYGAFRAAGFTEAQALELVKPK